MEKETALKILRERHDQALFSERTALETLIPELKESEDNRIRETIIRLFTSNNVEDFGGVTNIQIIAWLEKQGEPQDKGEISDGYHTFNELYYYRMLYNAAFFNMLPKEWVHKSKKHNDGEECFGGGWFIVMANLPTGQISNHYELKDWDLFQIPEKEVADKWDGHTPQEAADRLYKYLLEKQGEDKVEPKFHVGDKVKRKDNPHLTYILKRLTDDGDYEFHVIRKDGHKGCMCFANVKYQDNWELVERKPAWSEEDEDVINHLLAICAGAKRYRQFAGCSQDDVTQYQNWLKSLKDRLKGE